MPTLSIPALLAILIGLIVLSACFSGTETALMSINRYRMKHLAHKGHGGARRADALLQQPDRLIGLILLGNNLVNIAASALATVIGIRLLGDFGAVVSTMALTVVILIFGEVTPKTLAALHPPRVAYPASYILTPLQRVIWPVVFVINSTCNAILRIFGISTTQASTHSLSSEELRTVVTEAGAMLPRRHRSMLLSILDMEKAEVEDIMIPRNEIIGIDIGKPWEEIVAQITANEHTRLPVYDGSIDALKGMLHMRRVLGLVTNETLTRDRLLSLASPPYFVPAGTPLNHQLLNFQNERHRIGFVVDEYGDIQGLITLEDILEEIVGEFTTDPATNTRHVKYEGDNTYLVEGKTNIRSLNRSMGWQLPDDGPRTLNGLITEYLEAIPRAGTRIELGPYAIEIAQTRARRVKSVRIRPGEMDAKDSGSPVPSATETD